MEGYKIENISTPEREKYDIKITLFRHGEANYGQEIVGIEEADDLTEKGKWQARQQAEKLATEIEPDEEITIWSSPVGRTLETAKIVAEVLVEAGFQVRFKKEQSGEDEEETATVANENKSLIDINNAIRPFKTFEEVRGLNIELFSTLVNGGTYEFESGEITFDKSKTNPNNLSFQDYYYDGGWKEYLEKGKNIPESLVTALNKLEEESDVHHRVDRKVERASKIKSDKKQRLIIVTHHVVMKDYTDDVVQPADFINLN